MVECHGASQAKWVGANLVRPEPQELGADIGGMEMEEGEHVSSSDAFRNSTLGEKVRADCGFGVNVVWAKLEEAPSRSGDGFTVGEVGSFHGGGIVPDIILLCV